MKCFAFLIALATLATMTMARISQMVLPGTVTAGRPFDAILEDSSYIQAVGQYGVSLRRPDRALRTLLTNSIGHVRPGLPYDRELLSHLRRHRPRLLRPLVSD